MMSSEPVIKKEKNSILKKEKELVKLVSYAAQCLAEEGLSWSYSCNAHEDKERYKNDPELRQAIIGEGSIIAYYNGFEYKQSEHGRMMFVENEEDSQGPAHMIVSWGVQGPGDHVQFPILKASKKEIKSKIAEMAKWLRDRRLGLEIY